MKKSRQGVVESRCWGQTMRLRAGWVLLGMVTAMELAVPAAQAQRCALKVEVDQESRVAYQSRGNRCEGIYDQPIANRINLRIAGFHQGVPVFDVHQDDSVQITVKPYVAGKEVLLRVISTRRHGYFQMDTRAFDDDGRFTWDLDVAEQLTDPLRPFDTAALACVSNCESHRSILLPVSFSQPSAAKKPAASLTVVVLADVELGSLTATLRQGDHVIFEDLAVGGRYLPPHKPFRIAINGVQPGEAQLSLSALTPSERPAYLEAVLLIPERAE